MIQTLQRQINQIEKSIDNMAIILSEEDFQDYCDHAYSSISHIKQSIVKLKKKENG